MVVSELLQKNLRKLSELSKDPVTGQVVFI
jgi:hypothetical protein